MNFTKESLTDANQFPSISGLKPTKSVSKIIRIGSLNEAKIASFSLKFTDIIGESIKILGYNRFYATGLLLYQLKT